MTPLYLVDDARARRFEPFALTRPISELRAGALLIRERWERAVGAPAAGFVSGVHLVDFDEPGAASYATTIPAGALLASSRFAPALDAPPAAFRDARFSRWTSAGRIVATRTARTVDSAEILDAGELPPHAADGASSELPGWWLDEIWHLLRDLSPMLVHDATILGERLRRVRGDEAILIGVHPVFAEEGATIEPHVCFDTSLGPVLLRRGSTIQSFTRVVGPSCIGEESLVTTDRISGCSIGPHCKAHGEISATIMLGHANKGHHGFVGHSYMGRWSNLGAGTVTSNLKNTYGPVSIWTPDGIRDTGMQFLGSLIGDHAKTAINLPLTTGTVVGAGASVVGPRPPKTVAPFSWGESSAATTYRVDKFLEVVERVMARRHVTLSEKARRQLVAAHEARWTF